MCQVRILFLFFKKTPDFSYSSVDSLGVLGGGALTAVSQRTNRGKAGGNLFLSTLFTTMIRFSSFLSDQHLLRVRK